LVLEEISLALLVLVITYYSNYVERRTFALIRVLSAPLMANIAFPHVLFTLNMAAPKRPELKLGGNTSENFKNFEL